MPYILSPQINSLMSPMWGEGSPYSPKSIYSIEPFKRPPVNYSAHTFKPHSLTHAEAQLHIVAEGRTIGDYFLDMSFFYGKCTVVKLKGNNYKEVSTDGFHWEVSKGELVAGIERVHGSGSPCNKVLISSEFYPQNSDGFHDPNYALTLDRDAADFLVSNPTFNLYGTSWKSSDYRPSSTERPIHKILLSQAIIFELLDLKSVPEGEYFFVGVPLRLQNASESPVCPMLFEMQELQF